MPRKIASNCGCVSLVLGFFLILVSDWDFFGVVESFSIVFVD